MSADYFKPLLESIQRTKKVVELVNEKDYNAWSINRVLANYKDSLLYANMMNLNAHLPETLQYHYLLNTIRPMKRTFVKIERAKKDLQDMNAVKLYYGYSNEKAKEALRILTDEQIALIKEKTEKGGVVK